jgi:uncharacterized protein
MKTQTSVFDEQHVLHNLKHYLPSQTPLKDFIHHNSLHAFQGEKFYDAIFKASKIFGFQATLQLSNYRDLHKNGRIKEAILIRAIETRQGRTHLEHWKENVLAKTYDENSDSRIGHLRSHWKKDYKIDLDTLVHPLLFRIFCAYLDQGIANREFPNENKGFLETIKAIEANSYVSFFKTKRAKALLQLSTSIEDLLAIIVGNPHYYEQYLNDQAFSHRGWSGMASALEDHPESMLNPKKMNLKEAIILELLLEIDCLDATLGNNWKPITTHVTEPPVDLLADVPATELSEVLTIWQDAFEWSYYDEALRGIEIIQQKPKKIQQEKSFQAIFCIDERECSLRRYIEIVDENCETLGMPGFFGVEFYFKPTGAQFIDKLCPAPVTPKYLIKEYDAVNEHPHDIFYSSKTHTLVGGYLSSFTFGFWAIGRLFANIFRPKMSPAISNAFSHMNRNAKLTIENKDINDRENDLQIGFTIEEMTNRVEGVLKGIGLTQDFAPIIYCVAHGSSSANNPHHGAHDCGACSGRPGCVNARVLAFMCNHPKVREALLQRGIEIPVSTQFVGSMHDTASDQIEFYDEDILTDVNAKSHVENKQSFEKALDYNAKERSRRFASIDTTKSLKAVRKEILKRSVSLFEPRPELGHGTNSLCIIGRRSLTKGLFLDRRAFMNSYHYKNDLNGDILKSIMAPIGPVCGGINLEYYFSRVDNYKLGAGTKLPHNVMGLIGVANSSDGDLRPGLPLQMIEVHDPIRLMIIVEHFPEIVLKTIQTTPAMYEWYKNEWVHVVSVNPETNEFHYFKDDAFHSYKTLTETIPVVDSLKNLVESAKEMETNHILDATKENLPIYILK